MQKIDFNKDWICRCLTRDEAAYPVTLPHDAMLSEPRTQESTGEGNIGWYIGGDYEYIRNFFVRSIGIGRYKKIMKCNENTGT